jgi:predicted  nucleic acid-binding Zn-ribbon protein
MSTKSTQETAFTENDIIFECPYCSKSMAIDKRGMGLTVNCPDCEGLVRVPTVSEDTSSSPDSVNMPVEGLADALDESREEINELRAKIESLNELREKLETQTTIHEQKLGELRREFGTIQAALDRVSMLMVDEGGDS